MADGDSLPVELELAGAEVLLLDADAAVQRGLEQLLQPAGLQVTVVADPARAVELITAKVFGVIIVDLDTPAPNAGVALVKQMRERSPTSLVFLLVSRKNFDAAAAAFRAGAHDVILKAPDQVEYLKDRIVSAAGDWAARREIGDLLQELRDTFEDFIRRLMEAERRAMESDDKASGRASRPHDDDEVRILFVDSDDRLYKSMTRSAAGYHFALSHTGGDALDQVTKVGYHVVLVGPTLPDLPSSLVVKTLKAQAPETIVIAYEPNGRLDIVEASRAIPLVERFTAASQLGDRLAELADAHRAKARERRYLQTFRERHYELLRRLSDLRKKIDRALADGTDSFTFTR